MRPPTALEAFAVHMAAFYAARAVLQRMRPKPTPYPRDSLGRPIEDGVNGWTTPEPAEHWLDIAHAASPPPSTYGARYGRGRTDEAN